MCNEEGELLDMLIAALRFLAAYRRKKWATHVGFSPCLLRLPLHSTAVMSLAAAHTAPGALWFAAAHTAPGPVLFSTAHTVPSAVLFTAATVHDKATLLR